jgi:outer membrane immunogenic protein
VTNKKGGTTMKRIVAPLAVIGLSLGFSAAASAADLGPGPGPAPIYTKAPVMAAPWTWEGFYLGVDGGGVWGRDVVSPTIADGGTFPRTNTLRSTGAFGGGTLGYNFQRGPLVFGVEGDLGYMGIGKTLPDVLGGTEIDQINSGLYGDATGRLGFAVDRVLFYGKGGFAFFDGKGSTTTGIPGFTVANTGNFTGWTAGGGVEYKIASGWSAKAEYLHFDFGSENASLTGAAGVFPYNNKLTADTVKIGVNYNFNSWGR